MKSLGNYEAISLGDIPAKKLMKAAKSGKISFSKNDLRGGSFRMLLHPSTVKKIRQALVKNTGVNNIPITKGEIENDYYYHQMSGSGLSGGSLWGKIWSGIKSLWNPVIKPALSAALDVGSTALGTMTGQPALTSAVRGGIRSISGVGMAEKMARVRAAKKNNRVNVMTAGSFRIN